MNKNLTFKKGLLTLAIGLLSTISFAQISAVTSEGDEVVLNKDGTWKYANEVVYSKNKKPASALTLNPKAFVKGKEATFLVKSKVNDMGIYFDPSVWKLKKSAVNEDAEYNFSNKDTDLYGMMISERMEIPLESFKQIVLDNAQNVSEEPLNVQKEEYRMVNGLKVLYLHFSGLSRGIKFTYSGYYYSNAAGSTQFVCYTSQNIYEQNKDSIEHFLNGLVQQIK